MDFKEQVREWVATDNRIKKYNELIKQERNKRTNIADQILSYAETNNMQGSVIEITDGKLKFQNSRYVSPLNFKFVKKCLNDCLGNEESVNQIMKYIKEKRQVHYNIDIKRSYN